jgi:hypothetical protein
MARSARTYQASTENTNSNYVVLTNANLQFRGQPIAIRRDLVITVYPNNELRDSESGSANTFVFCPPHGTWEVTETFEQVMDLLDATRS